MKRLSVLSLGALALLGNACEKHPAHRLPAEHATEFGAHAATHAPGEKHHAPPAATPAEAARPAPVGQAGEAPKFFPEKK